MLGHTHTHMLVGVGDSGPALPAAAGPELGIASA